MSLAATNNNLLHNGRPDLPADHKDFVPRGFPKVMFNKLGLAARHIGSAIEARLLGADWRDEPWPKAEPAPLKETHHDLIGGKPEEPVKEHDAQPISVHPFAAPGYANPTIEQLMNAGYPKEAAEQIVHDVQVAGGLRVHPEVGTVKVTGDEKPAV